MKAVCNFFQKIMSITQPDPETEGQSINKASDTVLKNFKSQKGVKYSDFSLSENDKIYTMGALLKLSDKK
jgi:hypothetical protein